MKNKNYIKPEMQVLKIEFMQLLSGSGVISNGIDYGGVDESGNLDPAAPQFIFDDF